MKTSKLIAAILILMMGLQIANAQDSIRLKSKYKCWISTVDRRFISGTLFSTLDSAIILKEKNSENEFTTIPVSEIKNINVARKGKAGKNAAIGAGAGFFTGVLLGFAAGSNQCEECIITFSPEEMALKLGLAGGAAGAITGAIIGASAKTTFKINGTQNNYGNAKEELRKYSVIRN